MADDHRTSTILNFDGFCLDLRSLELRKRGMRIRLRQQPSRVLAMLAQRPDQTVAREEIQRQLWGTETFVDFERGLNNCIKQIRQALNDNPETPRYVETIPRQGYRFIAHLVAREGSDGKGSLGTTFIEPLAATPSGAAGVGEAAESPKHRARKATSIAAVAGILAFAAIAGWMRQNSLRDPPAHIQSLVVLPLENLSHDPEQEYFADGMTDALTTELARIGSLRVISRTSAMHFKGSRETLPQIGQQLKVDAVVEGSAARAGDRIRITAQLIETQTDHHLWAKSYERNVQDVLALQDEVARDIAAEIRIKLTPEDRTRLARSRPVNGEAHEAYLKGRYFWNKNTIDAPAKSLDYSRKAIEIDPELAPAYASLAQAYFKMGNDSALPSKEAYEKGRAAAQKALQLDDTLAEAHSSLADVKHLYEYDQAGADKEYMRAIELNPNSAEIHSAYSKYLMHMVRCDEAVAQARIAMEVDPLSIVANRRLGIALFGCGRNDEAIEQFQKTRELDPTDRFTPYWIAWAYLYKGMYEEAIEENKKMTAPGDQPDTNARWELGIIYAEAGKPEQAISILNELKESRKGGYLQASYVRPQMIAHLAAALGYKDEAMAWLEKSYQERDDWIVQSRVMQEFSILRSEPRYQNLLRRIGLPSP